jgi:two-component system osmolarity sensor histidine kinase EnvZ
MQHPRLKPYLPRSLFGRAALILIVPIVTIQLVVSIVFIQRHFEGVTRQMTRGVTIELDYLLSEVAEAQSLSEAQHRAARVAQALDMTVALPTDPPAAGPDPRPFWDWSGREVILSLRQHLPPLVSVDLLSDQRRVQMVLDTRHGPIGVTLDRRRVSASNPHQLLVLMMVASIVLTLISYVFLRNQLSPISRLAAASEAFGRGQSVAYRPRGATEVRVAGHAFLDMRARIERQIEQRTLLLSGVSHDLRTPLTRMKLGLSLLPDDEETASLRRDVTDMERLVDEFLAFARGDAMEETELVDPALLVTRAVDNAQRAGQAVDEGPCDGSGLVALRPQAVTRALENLIGNAVRYGSRAVVSLTYTERTIRLTVEDDGPGIPKERRDEALQPFVRLDDARNPNRGGGVGLGLSIAADIARSHGGSLRLGASADLGGLRADLVLAR